MTEAKQKIKQELQDKLNKYFGMEKPFRFRVRIIHEEDDICVNSNEREILQAIKKQQKQKYDLNWNFLEHYFTKALILPFEKLVKVDLDGFEKEYKLFYQERIQIIINKYDNNDDIGFNDEQLEIYKNTKSIYQKMIEEQYVDFNKYKEVRNMFEELRNMS